MGGLNFSWNPIDNLTSIANGIYNGISDAWNDYSGVTATNMQIKASKENTEKQLAWERERATNAHQWEIEDLKKAGLNPVLSAGGSGAVTGGISPQMPDTSAYKGLGALVPLISNYFSNMQTNSAASKNNAEAELATTRGFTETTQQILNLYNAGLINEQTAGQAINNQINRINVKWLPYEKGVNIATDVVDSVLPFAIMGGAKKMMATTAMKAEKKLAGMAKDLKSIKNNQKWLNLGDGTKVNTMTGEIKKINGGKTFYLYDSKGNPIKGIRK